MTNLKQFLEIYVLIVKIFILYEKWKRENRVCRRWWVRPLNLDRDKSGYFKCVFKKMKESDPEEFFKQTRMTIPIYNLLLNLLKDDLSKKSIREPIELECRLAITLSYLSQGVSIKFLSWAYKIGRTTCRHIVLDTCEIIWKVLSPIYVARPTEEDYKQISRDFEILWDMPHCVGALDGKHVNIQAPPHSGSQFFNYKKNFSIMLFAVCDANYIFTDINVGAFGSQSDGGVLKNSTFGKELIENKLALPREKPLPKSQKIFSHYFVGDAAFPLRNNLMRPYPGKNLSAEKEIFNYRLSRARRVIENSFGILVNRWRVLRNTLILFPENAEKVVLASIALHNYIKLNDIGQKYLPPRYADWEDEHNNFHPGEWRQEGGNLRSARMGSNNATRQAFNLRDELKEYFINEGSVSFQFNRR